jgi:predicted  nucleic acid-binding Zn-ribbon protein
MASKRKLKRKLAKLTRKHWIERSDLQIKTDMAQYRAHFAEIEVEQLAKENASLRHEIETLHDELDDLNDEIEDLWLQVRAADGATAPTEVPEANVVQTQTNTPAYTNGEASVSQVPCS